MFDKSYSVKVFVGQHMIPQFDSRLKRFQIYDKVQMKGSSICIAFAVILAKAKRSSYNTFDVKNFLNVVGEDRLTAKKDSLVTAFHYFYMSIQVLYDTHKRNL